MKEITIQILGSDEDAVDSVYRQIQRLIDGPSWPGAPRNGILQVSYNPWASDSDRITGVVLVDPPGEPPIA